MKGVYNIMNEYDKFDENEEQLDQFIKDSQREEKEKKRIESNILEDVKKSTSQNIFDIILHLQSKFHKKQLYLTQNNTFPHYSLYLRIGKTK